MSKLTISEALTRLEDGNWHEVAFVTADINKNEGGKIVRIPKCKIIAHNNLRKSDEGLVTLNAHARKSQNHHVNATRNLTLENNMMRKMHIYLLFSIDKMAVL